MRLISFTSKNYSSLIINRLKVLKNFDYPSYLDFLNLKVMFASQACINFLKAMDFDTKETKRETQESRHVKENPRLKNYHRLYLKVLR